MPLSTLKPSEMRASAPVASTNGTAPSSKAKGHQNWPEPRAPGLDRGFADRLAMNEPAFARHLDDQDAVLRRQWRTHIQIASLIAVQNVQHGIECHDVAA